MRLRYVSLFALLSACATDTQPPAPMPQAPVAPPVAAGEPAPASSSSASSAPAAAEPAPAPVPAITYANFDQWKQNFISKAASRGFDPVFTSQVLENVQPLSNVLSSDNQQPEFSKPASSYMRQAVSPTRAAAARTRLDANTNVSAIVTRFGVPAHLLGGIWTMESDLGRVQGNIDVISALATLAYDGRRRVWAEDELIACLTILRDHKIGRDTLKGSWAGAMGQTQFLPDNYIRLGADGDNDGIVDIWKSDSDALASSANLLAKAGWKPDQDWAVEVILPAGFDYYLGETVKKTPAEWAALGVKRADGGYWRPTEQGEQTTLLLPSGAKGPAFLALPNHYVIRKYNNSTSYALAVGLIADLIAGKPALKTPWPTEPPLSLEQRKKTQEALKAAGYDIGTVDGVIGVKTRQAIRDWQKARGEVADGYLSFELANRFVVMQGGTPATPPS
ncbi:lytic murein transglycosylase [Asticcacaulis sp. AC460]|uniref:lytic murein transglycosylase n=1 Tax=Asticcacaulis sp. AC460 TaxID=1282360 RepID=UPI0003C3FDE6|nr:lytic murein transglycosylase [Asticcacaulis sp. AC460]ESQ92220.1 lytic murein transglycosylase [Asticcacaulis sp. AC460]